MRIRFLRPKPKIEYCDLVRVLDLREISNRAPFTLACEIYLNTSTKDAFCRQTVSMMSNPDGMNIIESIVAQFENGARRQDFLWDFTINTSEQLKQQVYSILHYFLCNLICFSFFVTS